ncbi:MAG: RNA 2',3'-cyclic phosphodiesterase [Deltaproteobacteria bacterium]|nr:RNA 2',3'-cyclic phosphodiesterase [Deltaproteobacteria bacterium]
MRLFFAVDLPEELVTRLAAVADRLRPAASRLGNFRWVAPASLHVTLKFLGEVDEGRLPLLEKLAAGCRPGAFELVPGGWGYFPAAHRPRVFWLGFAGDVEAMRRLAGQVDKAAAGIGIEPEKRSYTPHLTLARIREQRCRRAAAFQELAGRAAELLGPAASFRVENFVLYQSTLTPKGAVYRQVAVFPLGD